MSEITIDPNIQAQLQATEQIVKALTPLDTEARSRVLTHVCQLLAIPPGSAPIPPQPLATPSMMPLAITGGQPPVAGRFADIRSLKEAKLPKTDREMACLVGYYLKELAPPDERKAEISAADIEKYFNQAGFALPKHPQMVLPSAKNAGYFDAVDRGNYRLNPVGFNLAVYGLPSKPGSEEHKPRKRNSKGKK